MTRQLVLDPGVQPLRNYALDPRAITLSTSGAGRVAPDRWPTDSAYFSVAGATDGPPGIASYARLTATTGTRTGLGFHLSQNAAGAALATPSKCLKVSPGETYTLSHFVRTSASGIQWTPLCRVADASGTWVASTVVGGYATLAPNTWTRIPITVTIPDGGALLGFTAHSGTTTLPLGATVDITGLMITSGPTLYDFQDALTPGWAWTGPANASESVGYPYTLESIAGPPAIQMEGPGVAAIAPPSPLSPRTLYAVVDILATTDNYHGFMRVGDNITANGALTIQTSAPGAANLGARLDTKGGVFNLSRGVGGVRTIGRHVASVQASDGMTVLRYGFDSVALAELANATPGDGIPGTLFALYSNAGTDLPVYGAQYFAEHDTETRRRVMAWLARKYGAPIPAGY